MSVEREVGAILVGGTCDQVTRPYYCRFILIARNVSRASGPVAPGK